MIREKHVFGGLPVQERYPAMRCGISVVNLRTGGEAGTFDFTGGCTELFDVRFLPGVLRPMILNSDKDVAGQAVTAPGSRTGSAPVPFGRKHDEDTPLWCNSATSTARFRQCLVAFRSLAD